MLITYSSDFCNRSQMLKMAVKCLSLEEAQPHIKVLNSSILLRTISSYLYRILYSLPCNNCEAIVVSHYHCPMCTKTVKRKHDYERHLQRKHPVPSMPLTSKSSVTENGQNKEGSKSKYTECSICQKTFKQWSSWHRHMNECHGEDMKCYGNCVDPLRGIYFVYSLEGTAAS